MRRISKKVALLALAATPLGAVQAQDTARTLCAFDYIGANGPMYATARDFAAAAANWGVRFNLRPYTDENVALGDFKAHKCDAMAVTGIANRQIVPFAGSIMMMAALRNYEETKTATLALLAPKAASYNINGNYETVATIPTGPVYLFIRNRNWKTLHDLTGKRIAVIGVDRQATEMAAFAGASLVVSDQTDFASKFNNGSVDMTYAPAFGYRALELYKGVGTQGAVLTNFPLAQSFYQITVYRDRFPADFGMKAREWSAQYLDTAIAAAKRADEQIPESVHMNITQEQIDNYSELFRKVRLKVRDIGGIYDPRMMTMLRKVRCKYTPEKAECTEATE
jgi:hypothetical protein